MSGFSTGNLVDYVKENADDIITAAVLGAETLDKLNLNVQTDIKNSAKLMQFANTAPFQANSGCGFNASGSSEFNDRTITVAKLKWNDLWCPQDLENKYLGTKMQKGSNYDELPFEQLVMGEVTKNIAKQMEQTLWQGDTTNHVFDPNLKQFNGWLTFIDAASPTYATAVGAITTSNVEAVFDDIYEIIPTQLLNNGDREMVANTGWDVFRKLLLAYRDANLFHHAVGEAHSTGVFVIPATGLKVRALNGLNNISGTTDDYKDRIVCTYDQNLTYGTDMMNEEEQAKVWYSEDDDNMKGSIKWKAGCQISFGSEIVTYKRS